MKKKIILAIMFLLLITCSVTLAGCDLFGGGNTDEPETYTVTFDSIGGSAVAPITQDEGTQIEKPTDPTRANKVFGGWFYDNHLTQPVTFPFTLDKHYALYAKWNEPNKNFDGVVFNDTTVTYNAQEQAVTVLYVPEGTHIEYTNNTGITAGTYNATAVLTKEGYNPKTLNATLTINKALIDLSLSMFNSQYRYDGTEKTVALNPYAGGDIPDNINIEYAETVKATDVGTYSTMVTINPKDPANYKLGTEDGGTLTREVKMTIMYAEYTYVPDGVTFEDKTVTYDGSTHTIQISGTVPEGVTVGYYCGGDPFDGAKGWPGSDMSYDIEVILRCDNYAAILTATLTILAVN